MKASKTVAAGLMILCLGAVITMTLASLPVRRVTKSTGKQTFYDSLGGTALVSDPANFGQTVERGYLAIRTIVDTALLIIAADDSINSYFSLLVHDDTLDIPTEFQNLEPEYHQFPGGSPPGANGL